MLDLRNRSRYLLVCDDSAMELHRGRRFPLPFGHEVVGGEAYRPVKIPTGTDCRSRVFTSLAEAEQALLAFVLGRVRAELNSHQFDLHSQGSVAFQQTAQRIHRLLFDTPAPDAGADSDNASVRGNSPRAAHAR